MYYHTSRPWLTIDRLTSGRDIRLSTATMRALNSRRTQPTTTGTTFRFFPRFSLFCLLLFLLFVLRVVESRSVPHDEEDRAQLDKLSPIDKEVGDVGQVDSGDNAPEVARGKLDAGDDEISRSTNPRIGHEEDSSSVLEEGPSAKKMDETRATDEGGEVMRKETEEVGVVKKRRRNDVALIGKPDQEVRESQAVLAEQAKDEGIRRFDVRVDVDGAIDEQRSRKEHEESEIAVKLEKSEVHDPEESHAEDGERSEEALPGYYRKSGKLEGDDGKSEEEISSNESSDSEESHADRGFRSLDESQSKSKRKSSTVYLNAEEKKVSDGEQQSIVDGQIRKLISIRDDALDAQRTDKIDEAQVLNFKRKLEMDEVAFTQEGVHSERRNKGAREKSGRAHDLRRIGILSPDFVVYSILANALESYPKDDTLPSYIDPKNDTLRRFLTPGQLAILQMAETFLPESARREYSDKMFSCIRRFEYYSCVKYFAWPLVKQYFPSLPPFPDYEGWYPVIDVFPQYPIIPFPGFSEELAELPEVVDADGIRTKTLTPETLIIRVLRNTLKQQPFVPTSPSFLDESIDRYITLIPEDQLLTINMAEKLIPISYRPEFVQRTVRCMKEYNYLSCFKYSAWPTVRHFIPTLPDIFTFLPEFQDPRLSDVGRYVHELSSQSNVNYYLPIGAGSNLAAIPDRRILLESSDELETQVLGTLQRLRYSNNDREISSFVLTRSNIAFTKRQMEILCLAESFLPQSARADFAVNVLSYLKTYNNFIDGARYIVWPTIAKYLPNLPEFPQSDVAGIKDRIDLPNNRQGLAETKEASINSEITIRERVSNVEQENRAREKESRNKLPNEPVIIVSGTRFVPIFAEHPESVIYNLLRSVQLQSMKSSPATANSTFKTPDFLELLSQQQVNIINIVANLLPENVRPDFASKLLECLRNETFLVCARDVIWPAISEYFSLPNFPNFGIVSDTQPGDPPPTTSSPLSETAVKTGQHGDTTVTVTDTRFFPIYNDLPETIILNILKAVQLSIPNLPDSAALARTQQFSPILTEQQIVIVNIVESLLPVSTRSEYIERLDSCIRERNFLECSRDVTWPTIAKYYPWLPSFPNFGTLQNLPQASTSNSIRFQVFLSERPSSSEVQAPQIESNKETEALMKAAEEKVESVLSNILAETPQLERSYLNLSVPVASILNGRQVNIVRLSERGVPIAVRQSYVARMLDCTTLYNFIACVNNITWPTLKQYNQSLPEFASIGDLDPAISSVPSSLQILRLVPVNLPLTNKTSQHLATSSSQALRVESRENRSRNPAATQSQPVGGRSRSVENVKRAAPQENKSRNPTITPSVDNKGPVPGYAGQPPGIPIDLSDEKIYFPDSLKKMTEWKSSRVKSRQRRSAMDVLNTYYDNEEAEDSSASSSSSPVTFPNITESEYLRLLIRVRDKSRLSNAGTSNAKRYLVDTLNSTIRDSLTADQYEILKVVDELDDRPSSKGLTQQVIQCLLSLSFIRCLGIFIWPLVVSNLPSFPSFGVLGRMNMNAESQVQDLFGMSSAEFERRLLERKESIEGLFLDWYRKLSEDKFQTDLGFLKIKGYGNNEVGISFTGFREGRGAKLKDNKNLPSILTIISDIMEEVLDQRPESEKTKKEKEKKERSIEGSREADVQFLKNTEEIVDIKRSMNDDDIITMFLDKIKSNDSDVENDDTRYYTSEDAYDAFGVLFGTKLHDKLDSSGAESLGSDFKVENEGNEAPVPTKDVDIVSLESQKVSDELKVPPTKSQVTYDLEKEFSGDQEERQREKRARNYLKSFLEKYSDRRLKEPSVESFDSVENNKIVEERGRDAKSTLVVRLPRLHDEVVSRKVTNSMIHAGKALKMKMTQMVPGFGLVLSFLLQMALAHARAAASMAGMISNMALGAAMFGIIRDSFFGSSSHPKIKYVYDNDKHGPGISWPTQYESGSPYYS
ncbi:uncharacterized protein LOC122532329 [Frieseomelitta varia]|uniref:uncharacterized protein LOC122532329 n=1 Tax=Frieseomelitta varia TaxID=561572 RepID=UPI001CB6B550|nr:uncharacterized protein LOC122532329 [Frieseomelitta varia]